MMYNRICVLLVIFVSLSLDNAFAASTRKIVEQGNDLFESEEYSGSAEKYDEALKKDSESDIVNFNMGSAYYKMGDYPKAMGHFQKALLSEQRGLKEKAHYNTGNTF